MWLDAIWHGLMWLDAIWYGLMWLDAIWYGLILFLKESGINRL